MDNEVESVADALAALKAATEEFWATLDADTQLGDDDRAEITQLVEGAADNLDAARKIVHDSVEED